MHLYYIFRIDTDVEEAYICPADTAVERHSSAEWALWELDIPLHVTICVREQW